MTDEQFTRCPGCRTVFRVTEQQLAMRGGQVRCGHCRTVFDGIEHLASLASPPDADRDFDEYDEAALGPPTVTLRDARALEPAAAVEEEVAIPDTAAEAVVADAATEIDGPATGIDGSATGGEPMPERAPAPGDDAPAASEGQPSTERAAPKLAPAPAAPRARRWTAARVAYLVGIPLLALLLMGQAAFHFRERIAARWPAFQPALAQACARLGCTVGAPRTIADLAIQSSDLQADPAHQGLLILTATLRNRGEFALAYPYLELTLTDAQDRVVVRRVLAPREYAPGTADLGRGIAGNSEVSIRVFIDASATSQAGYRLYMFYG
jgi:predicted Zn finger-like uncharacterized protein